MMNKNRRILVGRRFEDFIRNGIFFEQSFSEQLWHDTITDLRYQSLIDRRKKRRRASEQDQHYYEDVFSLTTITFIKEDFEFE